VAGELDDHLRWLSRVGGMVIYRDGEVHVYRGSIHVNRPCAGDPLLALEEALSQARARWTAVEAAGA